MRDGERQAKEERYIPAIPRTLRAHSITASWKPRQIPKNGIFCSLAYLIARSMPSVPRMPKPPGTRIPLVIS
jgi:hypothetical protein